MSNEKKDIADVINERCKNGWELDVQYYIFHKEKTLVKHIRLDSQNYLEFKLRYNSQNQIVLHISKFYHKKEDAFASTNGMGKTKVLYETKFEKKIVHNLVKATRDLTDSELMKINNSTKVSKSNGIVLQSEEF